MTLLNPQEIEAVVQTLPGLALFAPDERPSIIEQLRQLEKEQQTSLLWELAQPIPVVEVEEHTDFSIYQDNPGRFGTEIFGEFYTDDQIRVAEAVRDNPIVIAESANAVGKTHMAARIALWWYKCFPGAQVYTAAAPPLENLVRLLWGEIGGILAKHESVFRTDTINHLHIARGPQEFVTGVAIPAAGTPAQREAKFSGKHAPYLLFILDEADAIPPEVFAGIESCLSGGTGRLLCMYNPRSNEGPIQAMKERGVVALRLSAFDHPNVLTGEDVIPGAVTRNKTLHRIHKWTVPTTMEGVRGVGRFQVPEFLTGIESTDEETGLTLPPLELGERIIIEPEFSYMVLGTYPGLSKGAIFDVWLDKWPEFKKGLPLELSNRILDTRDILGPGLPGWPPDGETGNVDPYADYEPDAGPIFWAIDDGYVGAIDPQTKTYTADSHPRVILLHQLKPDGRLVCFAEHWSVRQPDPKEDVKSVDSWGYPQPEFVALGPGMASLAGALTEHNYYHRTCRAQVEESIKVFRKRLAPDENGVRLYTVHPRCRHYRREFPRYKRNHNGRIIKAFDHGIDAGRYLAWVGRNGF